MVPAVLHGNPLQISCMVFWDVVPALPEFAEASTHGAGRSSSGPGELPRLTMCFAVETTHAVCLKLKAEAIACENGRSQDLFQIGGESMPGFYPYAHAPTLESGDIGGSVHLEHAHFVFFFRGYLPRKRVNTCVRHSAHRATLRQALFGTASLTMC